MQPTKTSTLRVFITPTSQEHWLQRSTTIWQTRTTYSLFWISKQKSTTSLSFNTYTITNDTSSTISSQWTLPNSTTLIWQQTCTCWRPSCSVWQSKCHNGDTTRQNTLETKSLTTHLNSTTDAYNKLTGTWKIFHISLNNYLTLKHPISLTIHNMTQRHSHQMILTTGN